MNAFIDSVRNGLTGLPRFSGRDSARRFWPYVGVVMGLFFFATFAAMAPIMAGAFARMQAFAAEHPDQARVTQGPGSYSIQIQGNHPELMPDVTPFFTVTRVGAAVAVALLAAAVTRRLHDSGRRGFWGLPPVIFLAVGLSLFPRVFQNMLAGQMTPDTLKVFGLMFANNMLYLASLGLLIFLLVRPGQLSENRFGPPGR